MARVARTPRLSAAPSRAAAAGTASPFGRALVDLCFERGFARITVAELCARAGVRRATFDSRYADLSDCLLEVSACELARYRRAAGAARAAARGWRSRLRATAYALYRFLEEDERIARLLTVELAAAGERPARLLATEIGAFSELIDAGRQLPSAPATLTHATAEALGGAIFQQLCLGALGGPSPQPEAELVPTLLYMAVLPYAGDAAAAELHLPPPPR